MIAGVDNSLLVLPFMLLHTLAECERELLRDSEERRLTISMYLWSGER